MKTWGITQKDRKQIFVNAERKLAKKLSKEHCPNGGKVSYSTRKKALKALNKARNGMMESHRHAVQTVYQCPYCDQWHLTKRKRKRGKDQDKTPAHLAKDEAGAR